jgi:hypothetical protein
VEGPQANSACEANEQSAMPMIEEVPMIEAEGMTNAIERMSNEEMPIVYSERFGSMPKGE